MNTTLPASALSLSSVAPASAVPTSRAKLWIGRVLTGLPALWLGLGGVTNQFDLPQIVADAEKMGYSRQAFHVLGYVLIVIALLLCFRRTAALGAVIATGYLGGAVATHVSHGDPGAMIAMPILFAVAIWAGLALRNPRIAALVRR